MQQFIQFIIHHWELWLALVAMLLIFAGYELHSKINGIPQISPQQATLLINREDAVIFDLRDNSSFVKGHIVNAVNVPFGDFENKISQLEKYRQQAIILALNAGQPISKIYKLLKDNDFTKIYTLKGGIPSWQNAGLPLTKK